MGRGPWLGRLYLRGGWAEGHPADCVRVPRQPVGEGAGAHVIHVCLEDTARCSVGRASMQLTEAKVRRPCCARFKVMLCLRSFEGQSGFVPQPLRDGPWCQFRANRNRQPGVRRRMVLLSKQLSGGQQGVATAQSGEAARAPGSERSGPQVPTTPTRASKLPWLPR